MTAIVFIDGAAGTTGLEIRERLVGRPDLSVLELAESVRKNPHARRDALNRANLVILCLPDDGAREAAAMVENPAVRIIDASTAHRTAPDWTYGFPELEPQQRARIAAAKRVSNPGCYATGFLALARPLMWAGVIPSDYPLTINAISGYSGGGRAMIEEFENRNSSRHVKTVVRTYGLTLAHKHVPEMQKHAGLARPPLFSPSVGRFYRGMMVEVPLQLWSLPGRPTVSDVHRALKEAYRGENLIAVVPLDEPPEALKACRKDPPQPHTAEAAAPLTLDVESLRLTDGMKLFVFGSEKTQQVRLIAVFDNLGKGAAGAAVQNLNLMLGFPETTGLLPTEA
ncbi:MAG: N-acetyl-gamma-glutamyl-phosphate reductase [Alphaproteobacteria bacterium]|nr:N-acetyl-gamma-glutamyl-phosphate reductase [Alphaproteobacteria bacterium]